MKFVTAMQEYAEMSSSNYKFNRFGRRCVQALLGLALAGMLAACGGGGGGGCGDADIPGPKHAGDAAGDIDLDRLGFGRR